MEKEIDNKIEEALINQKLKFADMIRLLRNFAISDLEYAKQNGDRFSEISSQAQIKTYEGLIKYLDDGYYFFRRKMK